MATYKTIVVTLPKNNGQNSKIHQNGASRIIKVSKSHNTLPIKLTTNSIVKQDSQSPFLKNEPYAPVITRDNIVPEKMVRKRQKLDHLSLEQKIMRRKLKNRVAAQTARDRKKTYMDEMERKIGKLSSELRTAKDFIIRLQEENSKLHRKNINLTEQSRDCKCSDIKQMFSSNNSKPSNVNTKIECFQKEKAEDDCMVIDEYCFSSVKTAPGEVSVPVSPECPESSELLSQQRKLHSREAVVFWTLILTAMFYRQEIKSCPSGRSPESLLLKALKCVNPKSFHSRTLNQVLMEQNQISVVKTRLKNLLKIALQLLFTIDRRRFKKKV